MDALPEAPLETEGATIVLVRAARAANVAAACRAMKNMSLRHLVLVAPPAGLGDREARNLAYGAWDVLDGARQAESLTDAIADCTLVVGTSGKAGEDAWTPRRLAREGGSRAGAGRTAIVFGPESSGLTHDERALCHLEVRIPADPAHPSLNLAQAVLIVAYELYLAGATRPTGLTHSAPRATAREIEEALTDLGRGLQAIGYLNPQNPDPILGEVRRLLARAGPSPREASLVRGMARQILWAAARIAPRPERDG